MHSLIDYRGLLAGIGDDAGVIASGVKQLLGQKFLVARDVLKGAEGLEKNSTETDPGTIEKWQELLRGAAGELGIETSGTTGRPQVVRHSGTSLLRGIQGDRKHRADVWGLTYAPGSFAFWQVVLQAIYNLNPIIDLYRLPPTETLEQIATHHVTHLSGTPTFYRLLADAAPPCPTVQAVTIGGEALDAVTLAAIRRQFPAAKIRNVYASTQAGVLLTSDSDVFTIPTNRRHEFAIVDQELQIHRSLIGKFAGPTDKYYSTGDLVQVVSGDIADETSALSIRFVGRSSEVIHVGGYKVSPERVEAAILALIPGVKAARVYGQANSVTGQIVACELVVATDGLDIANFRERLKQELGPAEIPRIVEVVEEIMLTPTGKVKRGKV